MDPIRIADFEALARARMEPSAFDYYAGGAEDERTLADNCDAFARLTLRPRVLEGADRVETAVEVLGTRLPFPVALAPTGFNRLGHAEGETAAARGAGAIGALMCASTMASTSLEDIASAATGPLWFQLYVYRDREITRDLVQRAEAAGYRAIVLTVDTPVLGRRERDIRNRFTLLPGVTVSNLERYARAAAPSGAWSLTEFIHRQIDASLDWTSVDWLQSITRLPIAIKGLLHRDDGRLAIEHGAKAIVVSNHGGRQLDGAIATIDALPDMVDVANSRVPVLLDGGVRRGTDVLKALALGAAAVFIGRPYLWGLAADGESGVRRVLEMIRAELELAMALSGCRDATNVPRDLVRRRVL
jgi:4-hydroxymandelate oxidase